MKFKVKNTADVYTSEFPKKNDLSKEDEVDVDKLKTIPTDLGKLSNTVEKDIEKIEYDELVEKVNLID